MADFEIARTKMVENQLRANKVTDERLIQAMRVIPREEFVPASRRSVAYADEDLPMGGDRWLMEPMLFARLAQLAEVDKNDLVLDVGATMGYGAAVLGQLASAVIALEQDEDLAKAAAEAVAGLSGGGGDNIVVEAGPLIDGWGSQAPYDVIFMEGAVDELPDSLVGQLTDGGRLVAMRRDTSGVQRGTLFMKRGDTLAARETFDGSTPILPGFAKAPAFSF